MTLSAEKLAGFRYWVAAFKMVTPLAMKPCDRSQGSIYTRGLAGFRNDDQGQGGQSSLARISSQPLFLFLRSDQHTHLFAFHLRRLLDDTDLGDIRLNPLQLL